MHIKDIKRFLDWCQVGDSSLQQRCDMLYDRLEAVKKQMEELQRATDIIKYKCWYYDTALAAGTEETSKNIPVEEMSEKIPKYWHVWHSE